MVPTNAPRRPDPALLERLRASIRRIDGTAGDANAGDTRSGVIALGAPAIDGVLPGGGLRRAALHTVAGDTAAAGFCAGLLGRLAGGRGTVLWCRPDRDLHGPGLALFGLPPERLILVRGRNTDLLWAMEEGLRGGTLAAVLGEVAGIAPIAARRLQLAAEAGGVTALLLDGGAGNGAPPPAFSRWRVSAVPCPPAGRASFGQSCGRPSWRPCWRVELRHCRGGRPAAWIVEWRDGTTGGFAVAADLGDGSLEAPAETRRAG